MADVYLDAMEEELLEEEFEEDDSPQSDDQSSHSGREDDNFVNIHCHSFYSLLDGLTNPQDIVDYTLELGQPAAVISDHGVMYSLVRFVQYAQKKGQRPIIAMEAYVVEDRHLKGKQEGESENNNRREHLLLIAQNEVGYKNLMKLASLGATEGFYYRPRIDDELLQKYNEGLIATSACLGSRFSQLILRGDTSGATREIKKYANWFKDRFYIEIQPTKEYAQKIVNHQVIKIAKNLGLPLVATTDAHYLKREDADTHSALLAVQSKASLSDPKRWTFTGDTYFVASRKEMAAMFEEDCECRLDPLYLELPEEKWKVEPSDTVFTRKVEQIDGSVEEWTYIRFNHNIDSNVIEEAMDNTVKLIDTINLEIKWGKHYLPKVDAPDTPEFVQWMEKRNQKLISEGKQPDGHSEAYLRYLCIKGLKRRGLTKQVYRDRLEYELGVINSMGFADYFLILEEIISWCRENHIPVGPGRGCFTPGQFVDTIDGTKRIEEIQVGDHVLTHRGNFQEVKGLHTYDSTEKVARITFEGYAGHTFNVTSTKDHEYFIIPKDAARDFKHAKWATAEELNEGDIALMPIPENARHSHKGHEDCLSCQGKPNPAWFEEINRKYHETAMNTNRILEKTMITLRNKVEGSQALALDEVEDSLKEMQEVFGFNEVLAFTKDMPLFADEMAEIGYELAFVRKIEEEEYDGPVYDISVDVDASYVVNSVAVHNSGAGSIVAYATGITNVNPIQYGLLFERFLNPERGKLPDIDTDVCIINRPKIINHITETYGKTHVANIAALGRLQTKAVIKDVARIFDLKPEEANAFTARLPKGAAAIGYHITDVLADDELKDFTKKYPELFKIAKQLEGSPRHVSQHAAGIVISPPGSEVWDFTPVQQAKETDGEVGYLAQLEKEEVEKVGLVKLDLLGLKNVTEIDHMIHMVNEIYDMNWNTDDIPLDDVKTWDLICNGNTLGVFQFSSALAIDACKRVRPRNIEELAAVNTLIRPGASAGMDVYLAGKKDASRIRYLHPDVKPVLEASYGAAIFQEQQMQIIAHFANISFGQADLYRRLFESVAKGKVSMSGPEMTEFRAKLAEGCAARGYDEKTADRVIEFIMDGVGYAFNKSHSVCYSILGYWTAYFKANYPMIFYTVMLNGNPDAIPFFMEEAKKNDIDILPPHVNSSKHGFSIESDHAIRVGLSAIKGVGPKAIDSIVATQPFTSIDDFMDRNEMRTVNRKVIGALINTGGFDSLGFAIDPDLDVPTMFRDKIHIENSQALLNRYQLGLVWEKVSEAATRKSVPNYLVSKSKIKGEFFLIYDMKMEPDNSGYVIPETYLVEMGLDPATLEKTRKKPKGSFTKEKDPYAGYSDLRKALVSNLNEVADTEASYIDIYLRESEELGFSFVSHPLESYLSKITNFADAADGQFIMTAGIVTSIVERKTSKNKTFYNVFLRTPRETVKLTVWDNMAKKNANLMKKYTILAVKGVKGFGGLTVDSIKEVTFKR